MKTEQQIPCPVCNTLITFDAKQLILGTNFRCPGCHTNIGLANDSRPIVEQALQKLDDSLKKRKTNGKPD